MFEIGLLCFLVRIDIQISRMHANLKDADYCYSSQVQLADIVISPKVTARDVAASTLHDRAVARGS